MPLVTIGSRSAAWIAFVALCAAGDARAVSPPQASLQDRVNRIVDFAYEEPDRGLAELSALEASLAHTPDEHRTVETGIGLVAADHGLKDDVNRVVARLEALVSGAGAIAHADALLVLADLHMEGGDSTKASREIVAAIAAYAPYCDAVSAPRALECNPIDWFYANMFAGVILSFDKTRGSAGMYLQTAGDIARQIHRPDLEARALAFSAQLAQDEGNTDLGDRLLQRADALALRSRDASAREFVKMFAGYILQGRGRLEEALAQWQQAVQVATQAHHVRRVVELSAGMSELDLKQGHPELALQRIAAALPYVERSHMEGVREELQVNRILALLRLGRVDEARRLLGPLLDVLDAKTEPLDQSATISAIGDALSKAGDADGAMALFQREQRTLFAGGDKHFERAMLERQAQVAARQQADRRREVRRWAGVGGAALASLLVVGAAIPWLRSRNRRLAQANDALRDRSQRDPLTGLLNRDGLLRGLRECNAIGAFSGTLLLVDIDHFKSVNDTLGHAGGDAVLAEVARRLQSCVRDGDLVARWGGEELVVAVLATPFDADALVDRILQSLAAAPVSFQQRSITVSASIGYAAFPLEEPSRPLSFDESLAVADAGMYYAKRHGRRAATRISALPAALLADLGGLPGAVEREARAGSVRLAVRRVAAHGAPAAGEAREAGMPLSV